MCVLRITNQIIEKNHVVTGGGDRTRTRYLLLAKQPLSQLSYTPKCFAALNGIDQSLVGLVGLEPTTPALSTRCSNQLSYRPKPVALTIGLSHC